MVKIYTKKVTMGRLFKFALPSILMQFVLSLYTIVDGIFVSRFVGTTALSAINIVYPVVSLLIAISIMFATGGAAIVGKELGEKNVEKARNSFSFIVAVTLTSTIAISIIGLIFLRPLVVVLGASESILPYGINYLKYILLFSPALALQVLSQVFFITEGKPRLGLFSIIAAGITNGILDYVFIVPFNMGIEGAALATGLGYTVSAIIAIVYFLSSKKLLYIVKPSFDKKLLIDAAGNGSSEMVTNLSTAIVTFLVNILFMRYYGENGVAAITIVLYFQFIFLAIYFGYSIGIAPIVSFKFGEKNSKDLRRIYSSSLKIITGVSILLLFLALISIENILKFFTQDIEVQNIALEGFPYFVFSLIFMSISIFASTFFTALSDGKTSAIISFLRSFVFLVVSLVGLPLIFGGHGLWLANTVAEILALIVSVGYLVIKRKAYQY